MLKSKFPLKILAIVPGSRYLGIAIFYGADLRDWRIKDIREKKMASRIKKTQEILSRFISQYHPQILAIKKLNPVRSSANLKNLAKRIIGFARRKKLDVYQCTLDEVKSSLAPGEHINKKCLFKKATSLYPVLSSDFEKEQKNKNAYYLRELEAVTFGSNCFYKLDKH